MIDVVALVQGLEQLGRDDLADDLRRIFVEVEYALAECIGARN